MKKIRISDCLVVGLSFFVLIIGIFISGMYKSVAMGWLGFIASEALSLSIIFGYARFNLVRNFRNKKVKTQYSVIFWSIITIFILVVVFMSQCLKDPRYFKVYQISTFDFWAGLVIKVISVYTSIIAIYKLVTKDKLNILPIVYTKNKDFIPLDKLKKVSVELRNFEKYSVGVKLLGVFTSEQFKKLEKRAKIWQYNLLANELKEDEAIWIAQDDNYQEIKSCNAMKYDINLSKVYPQVKQLFDKTHNVLQVKLVYIDIYNNLIYTDFNVADNNGDRTKMKLCYIDNISDKIKLMYDSQSKVEYFVAESGIVTVRLDENGKPKIYQLRKAE